MAKADAANAVTPGARTPTERFHLDGPTRRLDSRVHAVRRDIADMALAGSLFAPHYARAEQRSCVIASTMVRNAAREDAEAVSQLLHGEGFAVLDISGGWAWGYCVHDHYVGYVPADALGDPIDPSHLVTTPLALVFAAPDIKSPVIARWAMGGRFQGAEGNGFVAGGGGYLHRRHIAPIGVLETDPVAVAERFLGAPYLWGGRGDGGVDCSGLIQIALGRVGIAAPRDADQQESANLGTEIEANASLLRGDLLFFPNHVAFMLDDERLIHANAHTMTVAVEPLTDLVARLSPNHDRPIRARRRLSI